MPASVRHRPDSASGRLVYQQGNPRTRFPWAASIKLRAAVALLRDAAAGLSFKPVANPSPIADHGSCGANFRASPGVAHQVEALSAPTTVAAIVAGIPGSGSEAGIGPFSSIATKTTREDRAHGL